VNISNSFDIVKAYLLLLLTFVLFLCRKLPIGSPRLNAFTTPSIAILVIYLLNSISVNFRGNLQKLVLPAIIYIGVIGNVFTTYINFFSSATYQKQMHIYSATENAIHLARDKKYPCLLHQASVIPTKELL
jgi:hypothetical protein